MQIYQRVLVWLNLTAPQLNHIQANAPPKAAESILRAPLKTYQDRDEYTFDLEQGDSVNRRAGSPSCAEQRSSETKVTRDEILAACCAQAAHHSSDLSRTQVIP